MKSVGIVFTAFAIALIFGSLNIPASGSIPDKHVQPKPEPQTACAKYVSEAQMDRYQQWANTLQLGLMKNPGLPQETWVCVMDMEKIVVTDQFVYDACKADNNAPFEPVVFKALEYHLDQCGISIQR